MAQSDPPKNVLVVIGAGGMGISAAQRLAKGRRTFLTDFSDDNLEAALSILRAEGHDCEPYKLDIRDYDAVSKLASTTAAAGHVDVIVHTAGVSPVQAPAKTIYEVDLLGTANIIDAFLPAASSGTSLICISSMAGYNATTTLEFERHLATAPRHQLLEHERIKSDAPSHEAYTIAKRGTSLRVQAAAGAWGSNGARVNSISPGIILTPMGRQELDGPAGSLIKRMIETSAARRAGIPEDVSNAIAFLSSPESSFISGTDLLVDGGVVAAQRWSS